MEKHLQINCPVRLSQWYHTHPSADCEGQAHQRVERREPLRHPAIHFRTLVGGSQVLVGDLRMPVGVAGAGYKSRRMAVAKTDRDMEPGLCSVLSHLQGGRRGTVGRMLASRRGASSQVGLRLSVERCTRPCLHIWAPQVQVGRNHAVGHCTQAYWCARAAGRLLGQGHETVRLGTVPWSTVVCRTSTQLQG
jgi:hypothetical protein